MDVETSKENELPSPGRAKVDYIDDKVSSRLPMARVFKPSGIENRIADPLLVKPDAINDPTPVKPVQSEMGKKN